MRSIKLKYMLFFTQRRCLQIPRSNLTRCCPLNKSHFFRELDPTGLSQSARFFQHLPHVISKVYFCHNRQLLWTVLVSRTTGRSLCPVIEDEKA